MLIHPSEIRGEVTLPPSKSMAHRAIICAALAKGKSQISGIDYSDDIRATIKAMAALGADIREEGSTLFIDGASTLGGGASPSPHPLIDCGESGSTLRFMVPIALLQSQKTLFTGSRRLGERPLEPYYAIFERQNIAYGRKEGALHLEVEGLLRADTFRLAGDISSQFISGLCFALPLLEKDSRIIIEGALESQAYADLTLQMLKLFNIEVTHDNYREFFIKGGQNYAPQNYTVEADYSQSAFFLVMGALGGGLTLKGLNPHSLQGDRAIIPILRRMGASIEEHNGLTLVKPSRLRGTPIDAAPCPDIIPVLSAAAACAEGRTEIINAKRLRIKECDRLAAMSAELNKIGGRVQELPEGMIIDGLPLLEGGAVSAWGDHRIAMSLASVASRCRSPLGLDNPRCTAKSFPAFWDVFASIGGKISKEGVS